MTAEWLNGACFCITLDRERLHAALERQAGDPAFAARYLQPRQHLFSNVPVFHAARDLAKMTGVVRMIEAASHLPAYRAAALAWAPEIARFDPGPRGVLMGYDFHLGPTGPKLIEVNTNAGGAFLNALLAGAQGACCPEVEQAVRLPLLADFDAGVIGMFAAEWAHQRGATALRSVAIVDDNPEGQYLYPEFVLARETFRHHGIDAVIADPAALRYADGKLWADGRAIDLVYNRLVDFALERPGHAALRAAYLDGAVVVTPNPRNHALLADKRNLTLLRIARGSKASASTHGSPYGRRGFRARSASRPTMPSRCGRPARAISSSRPPVMRPRPSIAATSSRAASGSTSSRATTSPRNSRRPVSAGSAPPKRSRP
jgi:hypothetical protein